MKKILILVLFIVVFLTGCNSSKSASRVVEEYLLSFINADKNVKEEINKVIDAADYSNDNKKLYKEILLRQYKDLKYDIIKEEYGDDKALITVNINVYDLKKSEEEALDYLSSNMVEFYDDNNVFDNNKYLSYKLNLMKNTSVRNNYEIVFFLKQKKGTWVLEQPTDQDLEKIHGIYIDE